MPAWLNQFLPIFLLLAVIAVVLRRLPKVELGHSDAFRRRRFFNWFPLGLTYAFLYFGRYNFSANAAALDTLHLLSKAEFGDIDGLSSLVYGIAFLLNGPLTDRLGGRTTILLAAGGSAVANLLMGLVTHFALAGGMEHAPLISAFTTLQCVNMYFQSFGAVSIVKVNAGWFHVRERGVLGGVFGILISLGLYFAYDWSRFIAKALDMRWAFFIPAMILVVLFVIDTFVIRDSPGKAGFADFDTADATSGVEHQKMTLASVAARMFSQPVIWVIVAIEFCSGFLRNAVMKWYLVFAANTGAKTEFVASNWGMLLCVAGILGGVFAGFISDHVFQSRRGPVAAVLYGGLVAGSIGAYFTLGSPGTGWAVLLMSLCVIGVHGMLSGTASMDFGGTKGAGIATGIIDGFVYLGTGAQSLLYARLLPSGDLAKDPLQWAVWPLVMMPIAVVGLLLATRVWNAKPKAASAAH